MSFVLSTTPTTYMFDCTKYYRDKCSQYCLGKGGQMGKT